MDCRVYLLEDIMKKVSSILLAIAISLFIMSGSIAVPILFRGLYYTQIDSLSLVEETGLTKETIVEAYDEMMDYCVAGGEGSGRVFGTGELKWTEWGKTHFDDVAKLFRLDIVILEVSAVAILLFLVIKFFLKRDIIGRFLGRGPMFWGPVILLGGFILVGAAAITNFDSFFVKFHQIFFPGKENWIFDPAKDEIIKILPENLFRNFAILIVVLVLVLCAASIILDFVTAMKNQQKSKLD